MTSTWWWYFTIDLRTKIKPYGATKCFFGLQSSTTKKNVS